MTAWGLVQADDLQDGGGQPISIAWLESQGFSPDQYNALSKFEQTELWSEAKNGEALSEAVFSYLPGAVIETVSEQGAAIKSAATSTVRTVRYLSIGAVILAGFVASVVYRKDIKKILKRL